MQRTKLAIAIGALALSGAALAAPTDARIALSAGASAVRGNLVTALKTLCETATPTAGVFTTFTSASDTDITTYVCANTAVTAGATGSYATKPNAEFINFKGTDFAEFRLNVDQGSFSSAQILNGIPITHFDPGVGASGQDETPSNGTIVGGISDVEFGAFPSAVQGSFTVNVGTVGVGQTFGIGVSGPLYTAMFNDQRNPTAGGGATPAYPIPNSCAVGDTGKQECIPVIGSAQMAAIMDSNEFGAAKLAGAKYLAPSLGDDKQLRYVRRVDTSGTQASAQNFFLGLVCSQTQRTVIAEPTVITSPETLPSDDYSNLRVLAAGSTTNVRNELNRTVNPGGSDPTYAIGVLSGENTSSTGWRWLRIDGAAIGENAVPGSATTNADPARAGRYPFFYEAKYHWKTDPQNAFWTTVSGALNVVVPPIGLLRASDLLKFSRGADACRTPGAGS
jgi:hypothetical protein